MKLGELASNDYFKGLILGASGSGKTIGAMTFPGEKLVMDFDNKISSAAKFYAGTPVIEQIDVNQYGKMAVIGDQKTGRKPRMRAFLDDLQVIFNLQNNKQPLPFKTLVVDTITTLTDSIMEDYRYVSQTGVKRPNADQNSQSDYGLLANHFKQIMTGCLSLDCNVIFLGHTQLSKDETSGIMTNEVLMPGQMASKLGIYFEEVYFAKIDQKGRHVWQTKADGRTQFCRTQRKDLPAEIPASYSELLKYK